MKYNVNEGLQKFLERRVERRIKNQIFDTDSYDFPAVYLITNINNGKVYIGETVNLKIRLMKHQALLLGGYHYSNMMQKDFNQGDRFEVTVLEKLDNHITEKVLKKMETSYRNEYIANGYEIYNLPMGRKKRLS